MVADKPSVDEIIQKFKAFVGDNILIGHNIKGCDIPHITRAARRAGVNFDNSFLDTKPLALSIKDANHKPLALSIKDANHNMKRSHSGQLKQTEQGKTWD